ncbi:CHAT domain-containing protein [Acetobacter sp. TBRC 12305]|uniref:CHAT domain-containing protein n=1 Tax=Acetobacter garciniae TaxID=2817435 RepID=A0A939HLA2_9PROT|nr:CHAT domain-containing protein [Acetobacter garciniae]MBO1326510.1 CHAT domain-containing protein [Acetobacter garciniae]MBX0346174.1 CHAT domain-containing protein [Acetobacter garciniae]
MQRFPSHPATTACWPYPGAASKRLACQLIQLVLCVLLGLVVSGCTRLPPSAYDTASMEDVDVHMLPVGQDSAGASCTVQARGALRDLYCGDWDQPSGHIQVQPLRKDETSSPEDALLNALATTSRWRAELDTTYACDTPRSVRLQGDRGMRLITCRQRQAGWPYVGVVQVHGGKAYFGAGVQSALPAMLRAIDIVDGRSTARDAPTAPDGAMNSRLAGLLAAHAFSTGDIREYARLMAVGAHANQAEDFPAAIVAYRAALALQQKQLGADSPGTIGAILALALNLSNEGAYAEAQAQFTAAERLMPHSDDPTAPATLLYDQALDQLNQGAPRAAIPRLRDALARYESLLPPGLLDTTAGDALSPFAQTDGATLLGAQLSLSDPLTQTATLGAIEVWRHLALALYQTGDTQGSDAAIARADMIAERSDASSSTMAARLHRTWAALATARNRHSFAARELDKALHSFDAGMPDSRPTAETILLHAAALFASGRQAEALNGCRRGMALLRALRRGGSARLIGPCLDIYAAAAEHDPAGRDALRTEMFEAAEWIQGSVTARQIALAAARLASSSGDPKLAGAIRAQQDAQQTLETLYQRRDQLAELARQGDHNADLAKVDKDIATTTATLQQAAMAEQALVPNYGQLVQQAVPASSVLERLRPDEAFFGVTSTPSHTWLFLLHAGHVTVAQSGLTESDMAGLVRKVRDSITPGQDGLPPFAMDQAAAIYDATLGKVAHAMGDVRELVVAPSGALLALPFALLPTGPANAADLAHAPWLVRKVSLASVPTAGNFVALRKAAGTSAARRPWFGLGDFRPASLSQASATFSGAGCRASAQAFAGLPTLPYARLELQAAAAIFGAGPQDQLLAGRYTAPNVRQAALTDYRIVHFATHALLPTDLPCLTEPVIVASTPPTAPDLKDALLDADIVSTLHLDADLALLSACNTQGGAQGGEALSALARSFFYAGARAVMVTQWSVSDQASAYLVASSLSHIHDDRSGGVAASLRAAQLAMLKDAAADTASPLSNPFFWAAFVVIGDGGKAPPSEITPMSL